MAKNDSNTNAVGMDAALMKKCAEVVAGKVTDTILAGCFNTGDGMIIVTVDFSTGQQNEFSLTNQKEVEEWRQALQVALRG